MPQPQYSTHITCCIFRLIDDLAATVKALCETANAYGLFASQRAVDTLDLK